MPSQPSVEPATPERCRYAGCGRDGGSPILLGRTLGSAAQARTTLCMAHAQLIHRAQAANRELELRPGFARLVPQWVDLEDPLPDLVRLAPEGHALGHLDLPDSDHLAGPACLVDAASCATCGWVGYFDLFPEHVLAPVGDLREMAAPEGAPAQVVDAV